MSLCGGIAIMVRQHRAFQRSPFLAISPHRSEQQAASGGQLKQAPGPGVYSPTVATKPGGLSHAGLKSSGPLKISYPIENKRFWLTIPFRNVYFCH